MYLTVLTVTQNLFAVSRAAVSDPEISLSPVVPLDAGPKERKKMEFYNTRWAQH